VNTAKPMLFTPIHAGGSGPPLVCIHWFLDTWRTWELALLPLERHHAVPAPTLPGHAGGPRRTLEIVDAVERAMDEAGLDTAHVVGNSFGGYVALDDGRPRRCDRGDRGGKTA
jgi:pimeloyl-ACP methyl ester carboxylesterase